MVASELSPGQIDYLGHTVNVASRIQSAAEPGQLAVSDAVADAAGIRELLSTRPVRTELRSVKGVQQPLRLHSIGYLDDLTDPGV
jgi:class 3 adenylate cyclase